MTLTQVIEAIKAVLRDSTIYNPMGTVNRIEKHIAALPEPMTEEEIYKIAYDASNNAGYYEDDVRCIIAALKSANVLFVKE